MANTRSTDEQADQSAEDFDIGLHLDELRCHTTLWLEAERSELVREQWRLHVRELAVLAVLDERGRVDDSLAGIDGVSVQDARRKVQTARRLPDLPAMAAAAYAGTVSPQQMAPASELADPSSDEEWAAKAAVMSPVDLKRQLSKRIAPTREEYEARRARRALHLWRPDDDPRSLRISGAAFDLDSVLVERVFNELVDRMRPAKGDRWAPRSQRAMDALVELCRNYADGHVVEAMQPLIVFEYVPGEPLEIAGVPLPDSIVESILANAKVEVIARDVHGAPVAVERAKPTLPRRKRNAVLRRDARCRFSGCDRRFGLHVHHIVPKCRGGTDEISNLVTVCSKHHAMLVPHGEWLLAGNPNRPDELRLVRESPPGPHRSSGDARAGPDLD